jgi:hypothetical protein
MQAGGARVAKNTCMGFQATDRAVALFIPTASGKKPGAPLLDLHFFNQGPVSFYAFVHCS